ncbi:hypothetical protein JWG42_07840 [Desulfoprunum benzoelyticum]|uniref:Uncharacterized protein n=1 Tax=Desulfoprunum benzoelyticum TaxID=1506996 RepID=A0A840UYY6_9BACT|nr:hypothetical protein [Desulfoprunum benzoelyticum]MBB5348664.1 hypothetical protein [Desulfoprunum benzoelyticum]MBM9530057.1 hypothetical protein [Desulfoprunum benzoelyticum]
MPMRFFLGESSESIAAGSRALQFCSTTDSPNPMSAAGMTLWKNRGLPEDAREGGGIAL